jgi:hypothetical protein
VLPLVLLQVLPMGSMVLEAVVLMVLVVQIHQYHESCFCTAERMNGAVVLFDNNFTLEGAIGSPPDCWVG